MYKKVLNGILCGIILILLGTVAWGMNVDEGSIRKAQETAGTTPTVRMVMDKVNAGAALVAKEGPAAFPKFKGYDRAFIYAGTYIWIHSGDDGKMLMHPMKPKLEGRNVLPLKDKKGKLLFVEFNRVALEKGAGWVDYWWPKPGEKKPSQKVSYVKLAEFGGKKYVIGSGVYDLGMEQIQAAMK